jgi:hypothetical protein
LALGMRVPPVRCMPVAAVSTNRLLILPGDGFIFLELENLPCCCDQNIQYDNIFRYTD